ncbi:putative ubiquitin ligase, partial [Operophtera brumata]
MMNVLRSMFGVCSSSAEKGEVHDTIRRVFGVGDTAHSYAYDGGRVRRWNVSTSPYGQAWLPGDVIGSCVDLDKGTLEYYRLNGKSMGVAFVSVSHGAGLAYFPAVSLAMQEHLYANFGHVPYVSHSVYSPRASPPHSMNDSQNVELKKMSKKAFLMSLSRIVVVELGTALRVSYVVVSELLPRLRGAIGLKARGVLADPQAVEFYAKTKEENFRLCTMMDLLWTFLDESALCDIFEHCIVRECLLFDLVSPTDVPTFFRFDNFLNVKCPDESVLRLLPPHIPSKTFIDGELDFYNVDRLGGVLPFLVRTLRYSVLSFMCFYKLLCI